jgi:hypothetical protein
MSCPLPPKSRPLLRAYIARPWTAAARRSPAARRWLEQHGYVTPHFSWSEMAGSDGTPVPRSLRKNAIRHCWRLELFRHRLGDVTVTIDGPYRTAKRNREVGGASASRHVQADATDHYVAQVDRWVRQSPKVASRADVVQLAERTFVTVGNETSGTLHLDSRPGRIGSVRFVTWGRSR